MYSYLKTKKIKNSILKWTNQHFLGLAFFNVFLVILVLLRSAGYFAPFWLISVNTIVFIMLVLAAFILGAKSSAMFVVALAFFLFSGLMRTLGVSVWADRTSIYVFQALFLGVLMLFFENLFLYNPKRKNVG